MDRLDLFRVSPARLIEQTVCGGLIGLALLALIVYIILSTVQSGLGSEVKHSIVFQELGVHLVDSR